ncbi:MAG: putative RNase H-like nuclease (RuvC/YqgF family) [Natronomonas sp.]|jgi:predicted RNase H-like nuclease (RuvC/YqgF family)
MRRAETSPVTGFMTDDTLSVNVSTRTSALNNRIFGVDIQSGDVRGDAPSYAVVTYDGETIERDVVSLRKLHRRIEGEEPAIVATDNTYELAEDKAGLVRFLRGLPSETKLVQVTGDERPEPLSRVASRHGVPYGKQPMQEAEAAARLAARNVGYEVSAFTNTTEIKVSRGRSTGSGGWSEDRFTRRIHGSVKKTAREVESKLETAALEYEQDVTEKYGGYSQARFEVEATPAELPVSEHRSGDTRIEIERERRDGIEYQPLAKRRDHVVVGIDPGTTTAVAVTDLDGSVLDVWSSRTVDTADVVEWIVEHGRPIVVAADVEPMPETVEKIRRSFDAAGWIPDSDLSVDRKLHRTREEHYDNDHERDAMAAALFAFDDHADQFERIAEKVPPQFDRGEVIATVVSDGESVESALEAMRDDDGSETEESAHDPRELTDDEKKIKRLKDRVQRLEGHVEDLRETVSRKDEQIDELESELSEARREERREARERREVTRLERETERLKRELSEAETANEQLEDKLERLKELWKLDHSNFADVAEQKRGLVPVKPVEQFTKGAIRQADDEYGIAPDDVVYLRDASGAGRETAERLAGYDPRVVLRDGGLSEQADEVLFEHEVPVGPASDVTIQEVDELAVARENEVEAVIEDWNDRATERRRERKAAEIDQLISEHRARDPERSG